MFQAATIKARWVLVLAIGVLSFVVTSVSFSIALAPDNDDRAHAVELDHRLQALTKQPTLLRE